MKYRVNIENAAGEVRAIDYNSRRPAFNHFSAVALSRHTRRAEIIFHAENDVENAGETLARMTIEVEAQQPEGGV